MASPSVLNAILIDDEPLARQELHYLLESAGGVNVLAQGTNGIEAVDLIRSHQPDIVFLDVQMPGLDGFAVIKQLLRPWRRRAPGLPHSPKSTPPTAKPSWMRCSSSSRHVSMPRRERRSKSPHIRTVSLPER